MMAEKDISKHKEYTFKMENKTKNARMLIQLLLNQKYNVKQVFNIHRFRKSELTSELRKTLME
ncbi:hypothetical protein DOY81_005592 [Sarcophaga bullata]|nr:hypothetical protein DOY81_005592 [Sarcophaga bullata]